MMDIAINITRRCNKRCRYCFIEKKEFDFPLKLFKSRLGYIKIRAVSLTGGEPLLHPSLYEMIEWLTGRCQGLNLLTNGTLLNGGTIDFLVAHRVNVFVSISDDCDGVFKNLKRASESGLSVNVHHVLTHKSTPIVVLISRNSFLFRKILLLYPTSSPANSLEMYGCDEWNRLVDEARNIFGTEKENVYYEPAFATYHERYVNSPRYGATKTVFMDVDGLTYPCCLMIDSHTGSRSIEPVQCSRSMCPILRIPVQVPDDHIRICPLLVTLLNEFRPFSPARLDFQT